jgi:SAM-dependent methyltransferase
VDDDDARSLDRDDARQLRPGSRHYTAYVGPPKQYDFMGATQFRLLTSLGLRETHKVLDLGCGSLRAGRLLIPYLLPERYFGIEPNAWLVEDGIDKELGRDLIRIKQPRFDHNAEFRTDVFGVRFSFVVAQSIFSHTTPRLTVEALTNIAGSLVKSGLLVCTFFEGDAGDSPDFAEGWVYPGCVTYTHAEICGLFAEAGLASRRIPWFHPRQGWWLAARDEEQLPGEDQLSLLHGAVLRSPPFSSSVPTEDPVVSPVSRGPA